MAGELTKKETPELNLDIIKKFICPAATEQEAYMFLQLCKAQHLNPFLREAYLIKYGTAAATIVTGKDTFTKRADRLPTYDGFKAGLILQSNNQIAYREGAFMVEGEVLLGGWAEVYRKDRTAPFRNEVSLTEYERKKADGSLQSNWKNMPATMIRKVALVQSLREAFPDEFGGLYSPEEMPIDSSALPAYDMGKHPEIHLPDTKPPIAPPQAKKPAEAKTETTASGDLSVKATIEKTSSKEGSKGGKKWILYGILADGIWYNTFSKTLYDIAVMKTGKPVEIICQVGEKGNNLLEIRFEGCTGNPDTCEVSTFENEAVFCEGGIVCMFGKADHA